MCRQGQSPLSIFPPSVVDHMRSTRADVLVRAICVTVGAVYDILLIPLAIPVLGRRPAHESVITPARFSRIPRAREPMNASPCT